MSARKRSPQLQGIEVRHAKGCPNSKDTHKAACSKCSPSYRAWASDKRLGKTQQRPWTKNLAQARRERIDLLRAVERGLTTDAPSPTLRAYAEGWLDKIDSGEVRNNRGKVYKPSVLRQYRSSMTKHIIPTLGAIKLDELRRRDVQAFIDRSAMEQAGGSVRAHITPLKALYRHALGNEDHVGDNPVDKVRLPSAGKRKVVAEATGESREMVIRPARGVLALVERLPVKDRAAFATAALAGLRRGELRALRIRHIDFTENQILVRLNRDASAGDIELKSDAGRREVPILDPLRPILVDQVARLGIEARPDDFVFPNRRGGPLDGDRYLERCRNAWAGRYWDNRAQQWVLTGEHPLDPLGLHDARHTFASLILASRPSLKEAYDLMRWMGHSDIKVTIGTYGHLIPGSDAETVAKANAYLDAALA